MAKPGRPRTSPLDPIEQVLVRALTRVIVRELRAELDAEQTAERLKDANERPAANQPRAGR